MFSEIAECVKKNVFKIKMLSRHVDIELLQNALKIILS
jgi:hypothetical protein